MNASPDLIGIITKYAVATQRRRPIKAREVKTADLEVDFLCIASGIWGAPRSWKPSRCQLFSFFSGFFSALATVAAARATNEIGYAGDTSAATVTVITDSGTTPTCSL